MAYLATPTLSLSRVSDTAFDAVVTGTSGVTYRLFYGVVGSDIDAAGGTITGSGTIHQTDLTSQGQYYAYVIGDDGGSAYSKPAFASVSLTSTDSLFAAIHAKFNANASTVALISGGLWSGEVPENVELPYAHFDSSVVSTQYVMEDEFENGRVNFVVYALGYQQCYECVRQLKATFDYKQLTFETAHTVGTWPITWKVVNENLRWKNNALIHRGSVSYRFGTHQTRPSA